MTTRQLVRTALFAALTAVGAFLKIPLGPSAITLQFFFTAMAGCLLGSGAGALAADLCGAGTAGAACFHRRRRLFLCAAPHLRLSAGTDPRRMGHRASGPQSTRSFWRIALAALAGLAVLYAVGLPYMAMILNTGYMGKGMDLCAILWAGMLPFLPGDALKILVTALLTPPIRRALDNSAK